MLCAGPLPGGRFRLWEPIGEGGQGCVWRAQDEQTGQWVALKLVDAHADPERRARFLREARIVRRWVHPNIVGVVDAGELAGGTLLFLAMELLQGSPLSNHLCDRMLLPAEILPVLIAVCRGLDVAHREGILHRDIKPENIFLAIVPDQGVVPKILDFGLSTGGEERMASRISVQGQILGTPAYMSPEQGMASMDLTPATDVWAMGVILYEAVAGKLPFSGAAPHGFLDAILRDAPADLPAEVDARTRAIILRCLQKDPARRYASAASLGVDLERALGAIVAQGEPGRRCDTEFTLSLTDPTQVASEPPATREARAQRQALARPRSALLVAPFAIALCVFAVWQSPRHRAKPVRLESGLARAAKSCAAGVVAPAPRRVR